MSNFTPGPWRVIRLGKHVDVVGLYGKDEWGTLLDSSISDADARLIAAAPDLLDALQLLVKGLRRGLDGVSGAMALEQAEAAIAKATGGER